MDIKHQNYNIVDRVPAPKNRLARMVSAAVEHKIVIPAFNVPYLPMAEPILKTLAELDTFGMLAVARLELIKFEAKSLSHIAEEYRRHADPRVSTLHLDHTPVIDEDGLLCDWEPLITEAISLGYDSVMIDGSRLHFEENIAVTKRVVEIAHQEGVLVEAELGAVLGHEPGPLPPYEELFASKKGFTDPNEAREFVQRTGVDWLSVSIGSVHGAISAAAKDRPKPKARLDIEHLKKLRDATGIPLVLHGGSGIPQSYINEAVKNGIAKINIATDIRQPYESVLGSGGSISDAQVAVAEVIRHLICEVYKIAGSATKLSEFIGKI
ncbi:MAG: class II fructose-bisphosphate aldolase [Armatimonadetes bacterium]|nr:class II fructose-bisphosphate aldolase [Armatimonadota bacterium]